MAHSNRVGFEDGLSFWGGSTIYDPNGEMVARGPYQQEAITLAQIDLNMLPPHTAPACPLLRDERTALIGRELARINEKAGVR